VKATEVTAGLAESNGSLLPGLWRDSLHVTCGLTACTPGSAPGPTLVNDYGKTLPLPFTCFSWHHQLRTGGFCRCRLLLPVCPCWQLPAHLDKGEETGVLSSVNYTVSIPYVSVPYVPLYQLKQWAYLFCLVLLESFTMPTQLQQTGQVFLLIIATVCLQCFDAVGWASGRASDQ